MERKANNEQVNYVPLIGASLLAISFIALTLPFFPSSPFKVNGLGNQLPFQGTTISKMESIAKLLQQSGHSVCRKEFLDIGSGDGRVLAYLRANKMVRFQKYRGVEMNSTLYILSKLRSIHLDSVLIEKKDFFEMKRAQLENVDTLFVFGIPALMGKFRDKFEADLLPGTLVLTNKFGLPDRKPLLMDGEISLYVIRNGHH